MYYLNESIVNSFANPILCCHQNGRGAAQIGLRRLKKEEEEMKLGEGYEGWGSPGATVGKAGWIRSIYSEMPHEYS